MKSKGFTLLEVLIVVIIIGILASMALPQYLNTLEKARSAEAVSQIGVLRGAMQRYWFEQTATQSTYSAANFSRLDVDDPNNAVKRLYNYTLADSSTLNTMTFTVNATRIGKAGYWVGWMQTNNTSGALYKANALGGPES